MTDRIIRMAATIGAMLMSREEANIRHREVPERKPSGKNRDKVKAARKQRRLTKRSKK